MAETRTASAVIARRAKSVPSYRAIPRLARDPLKALVDIADAAGGEVVRVSIGAFRPYLVSNPAHVQHVLRDNADNYLRDGKGMLWRPVKRLFGEGILADGHQWEASRRTLQPLFTAKRVQALVEQMTGAVSDAVDELAGPARTGKPVDIGSELSRIVCTAIMRVLFADKVTVPEALRIVAAQDTIATAIMPRLVLPFVPNAVPMPGDRAFHGGVQAIDDILLPVVRRGQANPEGEDIIATLCRARDPEGRPLDERQIRNDAVAMFATTTETTYGVLTWLWPILQAHPHVARQLYAEIDEVVGDGPVRPGHLSELRYTRMVLEELLRLYPAGWLIPRTAAADDVIGGVRIPKGASIFISSYITQRMRTYWDDPDAFDPERFAPDQVRKRHRYTHYPFGGGPHQCLGQYLFYLEAQLIVATILSRFRFELPDPTIPEPLPAASLRPKTRVGMVLHPLQRSAA